MGIQIRGDTDTISAVDGSLVITGITSSSISVSAGSTSAPSISPSGDSNTGIFFPSADTIAFAEGGAEAARFDSSGRLLVGTSTARSNFFNTTLSSRLQVEGASLNDASVSIVRNENGALPWLVFGSTRGTTVGSTTVLQNGDGCGGIAFLGSDGTEFVDAARIVCEVDGTPGANDMPGRLVFQTTADGASSPTERMRIDNAGNLIINGSAATINNSNSLVFLPGGYSVANHINGTASGSYYAAFGYNGTTIGTITQNGTTAVAYNTSSDYRLKENVKDVVNPISRILQLKPCNFNFIGEDRSVDGFIAHEVQEVIPEAIHGEKDAEDEDGKPIYQGIDQSKLVPLLTAALQEAVAKIESLEARLAAAGI